LPRNFLHSSRIELVHPRSGEPLSYASPIPDELVSFLKLLETRE